MKFATKGDWCEIQIVWRNFSSLGSKHSPRSWARHLTACFSGEDALWLTAAARGLYWPSPSVNAWKCTSVKRGNGWQTAWSSADCPWIITVRSKKESEGKAAAAAYLCLPVSPLLLSAPSVFALSLVELWHWVWINLCASAPTQQVTLLLADAFFQPLVCYNAAARF